MKDINIDISTIDYKKPIGHYCSVYGLSVNALRNRFKKLGVYERFAFTGKVNPSGMRNKLAKEEYTKNPKKCAQCESVIPYEKKKNQFCSASCSAFFTQKESGHRIFTEEEKQKLSNTIREAYASGKILPSIPKKEKIKKTCPICSKEFLVLPSASHRKFCSKECGNKGSDKSNMGGYRPTAGRGKSGWYKGIFCNSSWELAWVIYSLEHGITFQRNNQGFEYEFEGKTHKYYPDFRMEDGTFTEIKGWVIDKWKAKKDNFPHKLQILYKEELKPMLEYVIKKYGYDYTRLYEGNPHNDSNNKCKVCGCSCKNQYCSRACSGKAARQRNFAGIV